MAFQKDSKYPPSKWVDALQILTDPVRGKCLKFSVSYPEDKPDLIYISIWRMIMPKDGSEGNPFPTKNKNGGWVMIGGIFLDELREMTLAIEQIRKFVEELQENPPEKKEPEQKKEVKKETKEEDIPF